MKMWLYRTDLDEHSFNVPDMNNLDKENDEIDGYLKVYTDCIQKSEASFPVEAIQPLEALLQHYPNHEALLIRKAYLQSKGGLIQPDNTLATLDAILVANPQHEEALKLSIDIYFTQQKFAEALPLLTTLINCEPEVVYHFTLRRRAEAYHALNQPGAALADLNRALSKDAFREAVDRREAREFVANWQHHRLFKYQPILPGLDETYGVTPDKYTEYDEQEQKEACSLLYTTINTARMTLGFHQPEAITVSSSNAADVRKVEESQTFSAAK